MKKNIMITGVLVMMFSVLAQLSFALEVENTTNELTELETETMLFVREEEKLARDVYSKLNETYNLNVFSNIIESEQRHMDAVKSLIDYYGLVDPVINNEVGAFSNLAILELYSLLVDWGDNSLGDALLVGVFIEEYDIIDLLKAIEETDKEKIKIVYETICDGSYNHLNSFVHNYELKIGEYSQDILFDSLLRQGFDSDEIEHMILSNELFDDAICEHDNQNKNQLGR